ncbi:MAG TPA: response regulator, partial [Magnetospirillum sp.]|nr:response regulator [Magnetospirillum sp.]
HGIEPPERRRAAGKDHAGTLSLRVAVSGARLEIRVRDDGGGIAVDRLAAEAVARGMMTPAQAAYAGDDRLRLLVFQPGLSTADTLSTAAGRGIGMSIVRRVVDRLQGNITLHSAQGQGTEVVLSVPVSVMAQQIVLLRVRGQVFGVPAPALARIVQVAADAVRQVDGGSAALVDGDEVPLADLGAVLGLPGDAPDCCRGLLWVVAIRTPTGVLGLVVDDVLEVRDLPVAPLDAPLADDDRLVGTVMLEREKLALVLSPAGLRMEGGAASRGAVALNCRALPPRILVVDDSPTIRALERSILEAHAYRVDSAEDGREALDRMENDPPDVVVSDLDMPRLDGFGLLVAMRGHPRLSTVPVVLVSSRDSDDDRRRGLALGAAAYLIKTRFSQGEFLNVIGRLSS